MLRILGQSYGLFFAGVVALSACSNNSFQGGAKVRKRAIVSPTPSPDFFPDTPPPNDDNLIPDGTNFAKIGVNLDDHGGDLDFNDTVYCFSFNGVLENGINIVSTAAQTVSVARTNISAASHAMVLEVKDKDGNVKSTQTDYSSSRTSTNLSLTMNRGDRLVVTWNDNGIMRSMGETRHFRVLPDQCNQTGR